MTYYDYENSPELADIRSYFTQEEWKLVCSLHKQLDEQKKHSDKIIAKWLKRNKVLTLRHKVFLFIDIIPTYLWKTNNKYSLLETVTNRILQQ